MTPPTMENLAPTKFTVCKSPLPSPVWRITKLLHAINQSARYILI